MRALFGDAFGAGAERRMVEKHRGRMITGTFSFAQPADPAAVQEHLDGSVQRVRSGYSTGQHHPPTELLIGALAAITAAVTAGRPAVSINLSAWATGRVRAILTACTERAAADSLFDVARSVAAIRDAWDKFSAYDPRAEAAEMGRAPSVADDTGGWRPA